MGASASAGQDAVENRENTYCCNDEKIDFANLQRMGISGEFGCCSETLISQRRLQKRKHLRPTSENETEQAASAPKRGFSATSGSGLPPERSFGMMQIDGTSSVATDKNRRSATIMRNILIGDTNKTPTWKKDPEPLANWTEQEQSVVICLLRENPEAQKHPEQLQVVFQRMQMKLPHKSIEEIQACYRHLEVMRIAYFGPNMAKRTSVGIFPQSSPNRNSTDRRRDSGANTFH